MPLRLSPDTEAVVNSLFVPQDRDEAVRLLVNECGNNLPNSKNEDEYQLEDLRLQVLCLSKGDLKKLVTAIDIAKQDFRELSVAGNTRAFKREVLGDIQGARRIHFLDRVYVVLLIIAGVVALSMGATGASIRWLTLPFLLVFITYNAICHNSSPVKLNWLEYVLLLASLFYGVLISSIGYMIGYFLEKVFNN